MNKRMMTQSPKFHIADAIRLICNNFNMDARRVLLRAGLPGDYLEGNASPVGPSEFYDVWDAIDSEYDDPAFAAELAKGAIEHGFDSSIYSFYSSPNVREGLERKALIKPFIAPIRMSVTDYDAHTALSFGTAIPGRPLPALIGWFDLIFFVMAIRDATGEDIRPVAIETETPRKGWSEAEDFFGCPIVQGTGYRIILKSEDADRPLIARGEAWRAQYEKGVDLHYSFPVKPQTTAARVRQALIEGLPGGQVTADQIASALALSKRSLQRRLGEEDVSFKEILEDTRSAMAVNYLQRSDLSVQEIAFLLGFRDPSSFFRAFRGWTGKTPQTVRNASQTMVHDPV